MHRLAGILKMRSKDRHALDDPPWSRAGRRLPWLLVGLALSTAATAMMVGFEDALKTNITISFFIPALVYLADAVGTQTEAIVVRALSLRMRPLGPLLLAEVATGALIGLPLALLAFLGIWLVFQAFRLAIGVAAALFAASMIASVLGLLLPWLLSRLGTDPAFGSGPVATIIQDVLTIAIYFAVMTVVITLTGNTRIIFCIRARPATFGAARVDAGRQQGVTDMFQSIENWSFDRSLSVAVGILSVIMASAATAGECPADQIKTNAREPVNVDMSASPIL